MTAAEIIFSLGGDAAIAKATGVPLTTVNSWKRHNNIPEWRKHTLLGLAMTLGKSLSTADFPAPDERVNPRTQREQAA